MAISVDNPEADALTRQFAELAGVGITEAIIIAMMEAIERRRTETPRETAARLRAKHGVVPARRHARCCRARLTTRCGRTADGHRCLGARRGAVGRTGSRARVRRHRRRRHTDYSPVAVLEAASALARPDKFAVTLAAVQPIILEFLEATGIEIRDLPPAEHTTALALSAAHRYRAGH